MASHHHDQGCCESATVSSVNQTMDEMNFERGLWSAALSGEIDELERRLANGADVNARDKSGYTALHYAARSGHRDVCCLLLNHGAEVNATTTAGSATPLHRAAYMGHADIVQLLLSHGANPHLTDSDGMTALHKATDRGHFQTVDILVKAAPDTAKMSDKKGRKPLEMTSSVKVTLTSSWPMLGRFHMASTSEVVDWMVGSYKDNPFK